MSAPRYALAALLTTGCVHQQDVDVFVILPDIEQACAVLDAAAVSLEVATADGEHFSVTADRCQSRLADQPIAGFPLVLPDLGEGYHRLDASIMRPSGDVIGTRSLPFRTGKPVVAGFGYGDLPGWPRAAASVLAGECFAGGPFRDITVSATPRAAAVASVQLAMVCADAPTPAAVPLTVERGPITITAVATRDGNEPCSASFEATAVDNAQLPIAFGGCR